MDLYLAKDTVSSMQAGIFYGYIGQTEYIIDKMKKELEEKYDSEWLNNCLTRAEAKSLKGARDDYCYWNEMYNDFKNHDW